MKQIIFAVALALGVSPAGAKIYKSVLPDGSVVYSDTPPEQGAKPMELPGIQTYSPPPLSAPTAAPAKEAEKGFQGYESFEVSAPADDATVRDNGGTVRISLMLAPGLRSGHKVEIFMDGKSIGSGAGTSASVTNVDRGTHSIHAVVRDAEGKELVRTPDSVFHLKQTSRLNPARRGS